jgi:poly(3-hydroxybutyrate) depolymerase
MTSAAPSSAHRPRYDHGVPFLWPFAAAVEMGEVGMRWFEDNLKFVAEAAQLDHPPAPQWATANHVLLDLDTMAAREFSSGAVRSRVAPVIVDAPYAGHAATIADYKGGQSLVQTLLHAGIERLVVTDWKPATEAMRDFDIDKYLAEINVLVDEVGGRVNLVGLCQGGWMSAMFAARFPHKVRSLVLAGAPIDTAAGRGALHELVHTLPLSYYENLVRLGQGRMLGGFMLAGWKSMNPAEQYVGKYVDLYAHIEDRNYLERSEEFERWYEHPLDLPGRYYLQAIDELFKHNALARGSFVALGRRLELRDITVPVYLLAGEKDDITPAAQVFNARGLLGTPSRHVAHQLAPGGHIGLFMGADTLANVWPDIGRWICANGDLEHRPGPGASMTAGNPPAR